MNLLPPSDPHARNCVGNNLGMWASRVPTEDPVINEAFYRFELFLKINGAILLAAAGGIIFFCGKFQSGNLMLHVATDLLLLERINILRSESVDQVG